MTREEAKTVFLNRGFEEVDNGTYYSPDKWREACVVISEWLEQEPCEDAISRQAVNNLQKYRYNCGDTSITCISLKSVNDLPSVKSQEETGYWRHYEGMLTCSECGAEFYDDIMEYCGDDVPKCCPDCGAKMEVEQNG